MLFESDSISKNNNNNNIKVCKSIKISKLYNEAKGEVCCSSGNVTR